MVLLVQLVVLSPGHLGFVIEIIEVSGSWILISALVVPELLWDDWLQSFSGERKRRPEGS